MKSGISFDPKSGTFSDAKAGATTLLHGWPDIGAFRTTPGGEIVVASLPRLRLPVGDLSFRINLLQSPATPRRQILMPFMISSGDRFRNRAKIAWLRWCQLIPTDVREIVTGFPRHHWNLLLFLSQNGRPAIDLAKANPALAFALAFADRFLRCSPNEAQQGVRELLGPQRKQREILGWLGFPETESARRLLMKCPPASTSLAFLLRLRHALGDPGTAATAARLPRLNAGALTILTEPGLCERAGDRLLLEVSRAESEDRRAITGILLRRALGLARRLLPESGQDLAPCSMLDVKETYKGLAAFRDRFGGDRLAIRFARPPVPGTKTIVPITTARDLLEESWRQRHCAASYVDQVTEEQDIYFYRVLAPERCTLMLALERGDWIAKELRRACNGTPAAETVRAVRDWLTRLTGIPAAWALARELR